MSKIAWVSSFAALALVLVPALARAEPTLRVAGAADGVLSIGVPRGQELNRSVRIVADQKGSSGPVVITTGPFVDASGVEVAHSSAVTKVTNIGLTQAGKHRIRAKFPHAGKFSTDLDVVTAESRSSTRVEVEVLTPPLGIEVAGPVAVRCETHEVPRVTLNLREREGRAWALEAPRIVYGFIKGKSGNFQVGIELINLVVLPSPSAEPTRPGTESSGTIPISGLSETRLTFDLAGLTEPGNYEGTVRLSAPDALPMDVPFLATLKEPGYMAATWIGAGVFLSALLRLWHGRWRGRLEARRNLAYVTEQLQSLEARAASLEGRRLVDVLRIHVAELRDEITLGISNAELLSRIGTLESKLPLTGEWLDADRQVAQLTQADTRSALRASLDAASATLSQRAATDAQLAEVAQMLGTLMVRPAWRASIAVELERLKSSLQAPDPPLPAALARELATDVEPLVAQAEELLRSDTLEQLSGPSGLLNQAAMKMAEVLTKNLHLMLGQAAPPRVDPAAWAEHVERVKARLDGATASGSAALEKYNDGLRLHVDWLAQTLEKEAGELASDVRATHPGVAQEIDGMVADLARARSLGPPGAADLARTYARARARWPKLAAKAQGKSTVSRQVGAATASSDALPPLLLQDIGSPRSVPAAMRKRLTTQLRLSGLVVSGVVLGIAVISGLQLLWADDPVWGGTNSHFVAFLWGLGLHQVGAGAAFEGLLGLKEKFV